MLGMFRKAYKGCRYFMPNKSLRRAARIIAVIAIIGASGYYLTRNILVGYSEVRVTNVQINGIALLISIVITFSCVLLGGWEWKLLLEALGYEDISTRKALRIHATANIMKYIPGYAWQILGKVYLSRKENIPHRYVVMSIGVELVLIIISGGLLALLMLPGIFFKQSWNFLALCAQGLAILVVILFLLSPWIFRKVARYIKRLNLWSREQAMDFQKVVYVLLAMLFTWALLGMGFCFLVEAVYEVSPHNIPLYIFTLAISFNLSLLVVLVPTGIGVRESILAALLGSSMPPAMASIVAILARLILIVAEVISFAIASRL